MDSVKLLELPARFLGFLGIVPISLIIYGLIFYSLFNSNRDCLTLLLSIIFFASSFIAWLLPYWKIHQLKQQFSIDKVGKDFLLIWINGLGLLVEKLNKGSLARVRWIESWQTASDLELFGYRSIFNNDNYPRLKEIVDIEKQVDEILKKEFGFKEWEWGLGIHTRGVPGS